MNMKTPLGAILGCALIACVGCKTPNDSQVIPIPAAHNSGNDDLQHATSSDDLDFGHDSELTNQKASLEHYLRQKRVQQSAGDDAAGAAFEETIVN